jgi:hypothetical protein
MPVTTASPQGNSMILGLVSVVMMARAAASKSAPPKGHVNRPRTSRTRGMGYCTPMTPVEAINSSSGAIPRVRATLCRISTALSIPSFPVATLALRARTTTARARPCAAASRLSTTLGPANRERVNIALDTAGTSEAMMVRSSRPSSPIPALAV